MGGLGNNPSPLEMAPWQGRWPRLLWGVPSLPGDGETRRVGEQPGTSVELEGGHRVLEGGLSFCQPSAALWITWVELPCLEGCCISV